MRALVIAIGLAAAGPARADRELCAPGAHHHGAPIDLDLKAADVTEVFRLLADVGQVSLVVADTVGAGKVTLRLKRVPWDQAACTIAAQAHLQLAMHGAILMVTPR